MSPSRCLCACFVLTLSATEPILHIPPAATSVEIGRQPISLSASGTVWAGQKPDSYVLSVSVELSDLQVHALDVLRAQLDRSEPCGERINTLSASLVPASPKAILTARMHVERFACAKVLGKNVTKRLAAGDGTVSVELMPVLDGGAARLRADVREIQADGTLGELLRAGSWGDALKEKIRASVRSALDKATEFRATLPAVLRELVQLRSLAFAGTDEGRLSLKVDADAVISSVQLLQLRSETAGRR